LPGIYPDVTQTFRGLHGEQALRLAVDEHIRVLISTIVEDFVSGCSGGCRKAEGSRGEGE
jgi:hypothetical protein